MRSSHLLLLLPVVLLYAPSARADAERFRINPGESQISATIEDPFGNVVNGTLRLIRGQAQGDVERLAETASVRLLIAAASYNSNLGLRDEDVQENYLEVKQYPNVRFESTGVTKIERPRSSAEPWLITLKGELELHGVKREVLIPVQIFYQTNKLVAQGQFRLLLEDFKIAVPRLLFLKTGNKVQVDFRITCERQP